MFLLKSKDAVYENGNYRLNFNGRVTMASVKNFQLVSPDMPNYIVCQFGKVGEDRFHLDFKAPLNAISAFVMALCQFNL
jgi:tubby-related protein 1